MQELMVETQHNNKFFADILHISPKTIDRYIKEDKKFNPTESQKILKLEQVYDWEKKFSEILNHLINGSKNLRMA